MPARRSSLLESAVAAVLYAVTGLVYLRPIWRVFPDHLAPDAADPLFAVYVLRWVGHQARLGFPDLWNANVFYPAKGALAFSEHFLLPGLALAFVHNTVAGHNVLLFLSFVLVGLAVRWVLRASGCSAPAALLGGALYAFSPYRLSQLNHLAILFAPAIPLTLWHFDRLLADPRPRRAALFLFFYALNLLGGCYFAYMIHFLLLALLASRFCALRREPRPAALRALQFLAVIAVLAAVGAAALFLPYVRLSHRMRMARDPGEVAAYAAALTSYVSPATGNLYSPYSAGELEQLARVPRWQQPFVRSENMLFPGFVATFFGGLGLAAFWRRYRRDGWLGRRPVLGWRRLALWALLGLAPLAFALGDVYTLKLDAGTFLSPWLPWVSRAVWSGLGATFAGSLALWAYLRRRWSGGGLLDWGRMEPWERGLALSGAVSFLLSFPIVFIPLMTVVPGLSGMRVPARFAAFLGLTVVYFAARGLDEVFARLGRSGLRWLRPLAFAGLSLAVFLELLPRPLSWVAVPREEEFPEVYGWLAGQGDVRALIEIPLQPFATEVAYMYYSTLHWKPIVNGFSGFIPPSYERIADRVERFLPDAGAVDLLAREGVTHVVVHADRLGGRWRRVRDPAGFVRQWEGEMGGRLALVHDAGPDRVYRIVSGVAK
ncbi:MAG TPA: hypothetical protein VGR07_14925 [Thermoanaerobaculia bacterium]|nr:hypothetical protein [Thermoanaerobaculia bacterium]